MAASSRASANPIKRDDIRHVRDHRDAVGDEAASGHGRDRAGNNSERDDHGSRQAEDQEQRDEGDDHRYQLAPPQVGGEDPIEVTLDRGLTGDERDGPGGRSRP